MQQITLIDCINNNRDLMNPMNPEREVSGLLSMTKEDFEKIYHRNADHVFRVCYMFMKNSSEAEDALQDTFIRAMEKAPPFKNENHEKGWFVVTASNICKNKLKHWFRKKRTGDGDRLELVKHRDHYEFEVFDEILALPEKYKTPIYLYYYEGYTSVEIAELLGAKEATVRSQLARGREMLKKTLGGEEFEK